MLKQYFDPRFANCKFSVLGFCIALDRVIKLEYNFYLSTTQASYLINEYCIEIYNFRPKTRYYYNGKGLIKAAPDTCLNQFWFKTNKRRITILKKILS